MKSIKAILIWSLMIVALTQSFSQIVGFNPNGKNLSLEDIEEITSDTIPTFTPFDPSSAITIYSDPFEYKSDTVVQWGYDGRDAKIIDSKVVAGIFEIEVDYTDFDGYMCLVLNCQDDHKKHNRIKYYFNASDFSFIRKEVGELKEVLVKKWVYKQ